MEKFHDLLSDTSSAKVYPARQGAVLKAQIYGKADGLRSDISINDLKCDNSVNLIINAVSQRDFLSVVSEAYEEFHKLLNTKNIENESLKTFSTRFPVAVTKIDLLSNARKQLQWITLLMLLSISYVEHSQRVLSRNEAARNKILFSDQSPNDAFLLAVTYRQLGLVVRQCEKAA